MRLVGGWGGRLLGGGRESRKGKAGAEGAGRQEANTRKEKAGAKVKRDRVTWVVRGPSLAPQPNGSLFLLRC